MTEKFDLESQKINIHDSFTSERVLIDQVLPGLSISQVGLLVAPGGTGKSFFALEILFQVCLGSSYDFHLGVNTSSRGPHKVVYISFEDSKEALISRLQAIHDVSQDEERRALMSTSEHIHIFCLSRSDLKLIDERGNTTEVYDSIMEEAMHLKPRLIIIDTLSRSHNCDENNNTLMSNVISKFEFLAEKCKASILLIHHENKTSAASASNSFSRGASAIVDCARFLMRLQVMSMVESKKFGFKEDERKLWVLVSTEKINYSSPVKSFWLKRFPNGILKKDIPKPKLLRKIISEPKNSFLWE